MQPNKRFTWSALRAGAEEKYQTLFPERQIYFRSRGIVRFLSLSPRFQLAAFGVTCWLGITSASLIFGNEIIEHKDQQIADLRDIRADLHDQIIRLETDIKTRAEDLHARQQLIDNLLDKTETLFGENTQGHAPDSKQAAAPSEDTPDGLPQGGPDASAPGNTVTTPDTVPDATNAKPPKAMLDSRALEEKVETLEAVQVELVGRIYTELDDRIARIENAMVATGLGVETIVGEDLTAEEAEEDGSPGVGGPMMAALDDPTLSALTEKADRLETLENAIAIVPLAKPVAAPHRVSSHFGNRRDPFSKRWAFHSGIDLASGWRTPILATAPGVVTDVGWKGAYGRMVEVDHGNGFSTRYGHLTKALVEVGDNVGAGDKVGLMGSTGRSTGTHLHYEVRHENTPLDPRKFFEAAQYVQAAK